MTVEILPPEEQTPPVNETPPTDAPPEPTQLEKALAAEREEVKRLKTELGKRTAADEAARLAAMDDASRAIEEAKISARKEVASEYETRLMGLRVQARAAGDFVDVDLVSGLVALPVDATDEEIDAALVKVATEKPYLVKQQAPGIPPMPQGVRGGAGGNGEGSTQGDRLLRDLFHANKSRKG